MMNFGNSPLLDNFNSIKVRLELALPLELSSLKVDFNSIKVRLELDYSLQHTEL